MKHKNENTKTKKSIKEMGLKLDRHIRILKIFHILSIIGTIFSLIVICAYML